MKVSPASTVPWSGRLNERVRADITQARRFDMIAIIRACRRDGKTTWPCASSDAIHPQKAAARNWRNSGLGIDGRSTHNSPMNKLCYERADYSVVVKNRAPPPKAWRWEIYRAGNVNPIKQSGLFRHYRGGQAGGQRGLEDLLNKLFA